MKILMYFLFVGLILSGCSTVKTKEERKSFEPCGISLISISKVAGYPGDTIELFGQWGDSQGEKLPLINKGKPHDLEVISWSNSIIKAKIPQDLDAGVYRVGVYCNDLSKGGTYGTVFNEFEIIAQVAVEESTPQMPMHPTPQNAPCADQPKSFGELIDAFNAGQSPSPSQVNGVWVAIGFVDDSSSSLNCSGVTRAQTFEWVMIANQYSVEIDMLGVYDQMSTLTPDNQDSLALPVDYQGDSAADYKCRLTNRGTLACLDGPTGVEFKKMPVKGNQRANNKVDAP